MTRAHSQRTNVRNAALVGFVATLAAGLALSQGQRTDALERAFAHTAHVAATAATHWPSSLLEAALDAADPAREVTVVVRDAQGRTTALRAGRVASEDLAGERALWAHAPSVPAGRARERIEAIRTSGFDCGGRCEARIARARARETPALVEAPTRRLVQLADGSRATAATLGWITHAPRETAALVAAQRVEAVGAPLIAVLGTSTIVAAVAGLVAARQTAAALRPLGALVADAARLAASRRDGERIRSVDYPEDLEPVVEQMNAIVDRVQRAARDQRDLLADVAHELRSPLASMQVLLELHLDADGEHDPTDPVLEALGRTRAMTRMVEDMLELARMDELSQRAYVGALEETDLDELVQTEARCVRGVAVRTAEVAAVRVLGNRSQLGRVVRNLLDNAARHAASEVRVTLGAERAVARLVVEDDGPGIPADQRERVFQRFARVESARTPTDGTAARRAAAARSPARPVPVESHGHRRRSGAGLGLALVRGIVERHGGTVHAAESSRLGGAALIVTLPCAGQLEDPTDRLAEALP